MTLAYHTPLTAEIQHEFGITPPAPLALADKVRFSELDVLQHVNNAVYMQWFETVRVRYLKIFGLSGNLGDATGPRIVLRSASIHYKQEMLLDEDYVVTCGVTSFRNTSFTMHQQLWSDRSLRASLDCVVVLLRPDGSGRFPIPDELRRQFVERDGAHPEG
ncbi:MAG: acyl-CoA thioesterase [Roseobacter sp.]